MVAITGILRQSNGALAALCRVRFSWVGPVAATDDEVIVPIETNTRTDADGALAVDLEPGNYTVTIRNEGGEWVEAFPIGVPDALTADIADLVEAGVAVYSTTRVRYFDTRADLALAIPGLADGAIVQIGALQWIKDGGASIADLPGLSPAPGAASYSVALWGAAGGGDITAQLQAASNWALANGCPDLEMPVSVAPYLFSDTVILHTNLRGGGSFQIGQAETDKGVIFATTGAGTVRRWRDVVDGSDPINDETPMIVMGRNGIEISGIHFRTNGTNRWTRAVLVPGTRKCGLVECSTEAFAREAVLFDQTWSNINTSLTGVHPAIASDTGCNECYVFNCDLRSFQTRGLGIIGTRRAEAAIAGSVWGQGGASDFRCEGTRTTGITIDARCNNAAGAIQNLTFDSVAVRAGNNVATAVFLGYVNRVTFENNYWEGNAGDGTRVQVDEATQVSLDMFHSAHMVLWNFAANLGPLNNGNGGLANLFLRDKDGGTWNRDGFVFAPALIRPTTNNTGSLGTATRQFQAIRAEQFRSNTDLMTLRTVAQNPGDDGLIAFRVGNSQNRFSLTKTRMEIFPFVPGGESDDDIEEAGQGWAFTFFGLSPLANNTHAIASSANNLASIWGRRLRSTSTIAIEAASGVTTTSPLFAVDTAQVARSFTTRAAMIAKAAALDALPDGAVIYAAGWGYQRLASYTGIGGFPGWRPILGIHTPFHHGAIADGGQNRLSVSFGTLAAAQAVYPHAIALTDSRDWAAIQAALNTGEAVYLPKPSPRYMLNRELLFINAAQSMTGDYPGNGISRNARLYTGYTELRWFDNGAKRVMTRRKPRIAAIDPEDDPMAVCINVQAEGVRLARFSVTQEVASYSDPADYGADWDVGIFNSRNDFQTEDIHVVGYFRLAGFYDDVTRADNLPELLDERGNPYPSFAPFRGPDKQSHYRPVVMGARWCHVRLGPVRDISGDYWDNATAALVTDRRGRTGASDWVVTEYTWRPGHHHSGRRWADPVAPLANNDSDNLSAGSLWIDAYADSAAILRATKMSMGPGRSVSLEPFHFRFDRAGIIRVEKPHWEGGTVLNVAGDATVDSNNFTTDAYGPISITPRTGSVFISGPGFRLPADVWFWDVVPTIGASLANRTMIGTETGELRITGGAGNTRQIHLSPTTYRIDLPISGTAVTQTASDGTAGRLLKVGDFGAGAAGNQVEIPDVNATNTPAGFYRFISGTTNAASLPSGFSGNAGYINVFRQGGTTLSQMAWRTSFASGGLWMRVYTGGAWQAWIQVTPQGGLFGTVSQVGGIATGSVFEVGPSGADTYERRASGRMENQKTDLTTPNVSTAYGGLFRSDDVTWTFASPFLSGTLPVVIVNGANADVVGFRVISISNTAVTFQLVSAVSIAGTVTIRARAAGRWSNMT